MSSVTAPTPVTPASNWETQRTQLMLLRRRSAALLRASLSGAAAAAEAAEAAPNPLPAVVKSDADRSDPPSGIVAITSAPAPHHVAVSAELAPFLSSEHIAAIRRYEAAAAERLAASEALVERRLAERAQRIIDIIRSTVGPTRRHVGVRVVIDAVATYLEREQVTTSGPRVTGAAVAMPVAGVDGARAPVQNADASVRRLVAVERAVRALAGLLPTGIGFAFVPAELPPAPPAVVISKRKPAPKKGRAAAAARRAREEAEATAEAPAAATAPAVTSVIRIDVDSAVAAEDMGAGALLSMARLDEAPTIAATHGEPDRGVLDRLSGVIRRVSAEAA